MADIDYLVELPGVYDGWSIAVYTDGTARNRWANDAGDGPTPGYERRWEAVERVMPQYVTPPEGGDT